MITKARKWIMVASLMLTMCFAINNSTSAKAAVVTEVATQNLKLNNAINEAKNEYEGDKKVLISMFLFLQIMGY